jgi:L-asparagine transporter-like permease
VAAAGVALAAVAWIRDPSHAVVYALFLVLHFFCYLPVTAIALNSAKLHGLLRYFFALTAIPAFVLLLLCSIYLISGEFPWYYEGYGREMASGGGSRRGMWWGILAAVPAAIAFWIWYRLLRTVDAATRRA